MTSSNINIIRKPVKHIRIKVSEDLQVKVIVPQNISKSRLDKILIQKGDWINNKLDFFKARTSILPVKKNSVLLFGSPFRVIDEDTKKFEIELKDKIIITNADKLEYHIKKFAKNYLKDRLQELSQKSKMKYNRVFIRSSYTKWGNCSKKKNISLNWRLIHTPKYVIDYIIYHELLHTKIPNHSTKFWLKLGVIYPEYKKAINLLSQFGHSMIPKKEAKRMSMSEQY
ncbi:MAG: M48 family metallopeptidase [Melioribacteraceae bacterium]|nr:M48 family metallopeptidase [Melioribacteraceae bacterium]MCF8353902.1 M48 family metallopeptidase [Melioribacteraceae bacterium]MCF8392659.1 M48 family metallopeptidase [Melioribacteraceae bacterium]MCF8417680.1 M48 family metallopeptidase [Melioribacteraceae bacterium]